MFLINIKDILSVWTINYDILSIPVIDNLSLCNIDKYTFSTWHNDKIPISGIYENIVFYIVYGHFVYKYCGQKFVFVVYRQIVRMQYTKIYIFLYLI